MKKLYIYLIVFFLSIASLKLSAKVGCMSKTLNLESSYDYKTYHYVQCNCPCGSSSRYAILRNRGICKECGHFHELKPIKFIKGAIPKDLPLSAHNPITRFFQSSGSLIF